MTDTSHADKVTGYYWRQHIEAPVGDFINFNAGLSMRVKVKKCSEESKTYQRVCM